MTAKDPEITEKLESLALSGDLFPNYTTVLETTSEKDQLLIKYLALLDQYNQAVEQLNHEFKEGYINLSRANYANTSVVKPYGRDCWDDRVKAIKKVSIGDKIELIDVEEKVDKVKDDDEKDQSIRNRSKKVEETPNKKKKKYNPINMFGVLVPLQLRQSQSHFNKSVIQMISIVNLRNELISMEDELKIKNIDLEKKVDCL